MSSVVALRSKGRIPTSALAEHESELLAAARDLFIARGFEGTSIETIARRARVSPKTIYARYGGKSGLFTASLTDMIEFFSSPLEQTLCGDDPEATLLTFARQLLVVTLSPVAIGIQRAVIAESIRFPEFAATFYANGPHRGMKLLASYLTRLHEAGTLHVPDADLVAQAFFGAAAGELRRRALLGIDTPQPEALDAHLRMTVTLFVRALRPLKDTRAR
jgi:AcrR family transcriptional regulator